MNIDKFNKDLQEFMKKQGYGKVESVGMNYELDTVELKIVFYKGLNDL